MESRKITDTYFGQHLGPFIVLILFGRATIIDTDRYCNSNYDNNNISDCQLGLLRSAFVRSVATASISLAAAILAHQQHSLTLQIHCIQNGPPSLQQVWFSFLYCWFCALWGTAAPPVSFNQFSPLPVVSYSLSCSFT